MYTNFYNLHRRPFESVPDSSFLYLSEQHREVLYSLIYGIEEAKGFVLLAGDVGTGKTTLVRALLKEIDGKHLVISVVNPRVGFDDIFSHLLQKLGLPATEKISLAAIEALSEKLIDIHDQGQRVVLLIDEAHLLSEESLEGIRLLSNVEKDQAKLIQIVLVGQNEVYALLDKGAQKSLQQRIVVSRQLKPLAWSDALGYISHRLSESGRGTELFDSQAIALIWRASGGSPRVINQICDNALMIGYALEAEVIGRKIIQEVLSDMGPMRPKSGVQFFRQPLAVWPSWSIAAVFITLFVGLGLAGLNGQDITRPAPQPLQATAPNLLVEGDDGAVEHSFQPVKVKEDLAGGGGEQEAEISSSLKVDNELRETIPSLAKGSGLFVTGKQSMPSDESLWTMAEKIYGGVSETLLDLIHMANEGLVDINQVHFGQTLVFPEITRESMLHPGDDGKLHIHYASFYAVDNAQRVKDKLVKAGLDAFFVASRQGDIEVYRVYVGTFVRKEDAVAVLNTVEFKNLPFLNGTEKEKRNYVN